MRIYTNRFSIWSDNRREWPLISKRWQNSLGTRLTTSRECLGIQRRCLSMSAYGKLDPQLRSKSTWTTLCKAVESLSGSKIRARTSISANKTKWIRSTVLWGNRLRILAIHPMRIVALSSRQIYIWSSAMSWQGFICQQLSIFSRMSNPMQTTASMSRK